jgi:hypothetical protein
LIFSRRYGHIVEELKGILDGIPKEKARYKKVESKHTGGISFYGYFKDADSMRPLAQSLKGKGLYFEPIQGEVRQVFPHEMIEMASEALAKGKQR